jgi:hypothetical protein
MKEHTQGPIARLKVVSVETDLAEPVVTETQVLSDRQTSIVLATLHETYPAKTLLPVATSGLLAGFLLHGMPLIGSFFGAVLWQVLFLAVVRGLPNYWVARVFGYKKHSVMARFALAAAEIVIMAGLALLFGTVIASFMGLSTWSGVIQFSGLTLGTPLKLAAIAFASQAIYNYLALPLSAKLTHALLPTLRVLIARVPIVGALAEKLQSRFAVQKRDRKNRRYR